MKYRPGFLKKKSYWPLASRVGYMIQLLSLYFLLFQTWFFFPLF